MGGAHKNDEWRQESNQDTKVIQQAFDSKKIPEGYFVKNDVKLDDENGTKGRGLSDEKQRAVLSNICTLAEFIPGGSILSKGLTVYNIFCPPPEKKDLSDDTKAIITAVKDLEKNLLKYFKDSTYAEDNDFLKNLIETINIWRKDGMFEMQDIAQEPQLEGTTGVVTTLYNHTDAAASKEGFMSNLNKCRDQYEYGDVKRLVLLMGLMNAYATCMLLQAVCKVNMSVAADKASKADPARAYRASFRGRLEHMKNFIEDQITATNDFVNQKKQNRRDGIYNYSMGPVWYSNNDTKHEGSCYSLGGDAGCSYSSGYTERNHLGMFEDRVTNKRMEITAREMMLSGDNYSDECNENMRCMKDWKAYYVAQSEENIKEQLSALLAALETWRAFCTKLGGFIAGLDPTFNKPMTSEEALGFYKRLSIASH